MSKIGLVLQREYFTRVKKRSFIIMTLLTPLLFAAVVIVPVLLSKSMKDTKTKRIAVIDQTQLYKGALTNKNNLVFEEVDIPFEQQKKQLKQDKFFAIVHIFGDLSVRNDDVTIYSEKQISPGIKDVVSRQLNRYVERQKIDRYNIPNLDSIMRDINSDISLAAIKVNSDGTENESSVELSSAIGMIGGFLIYMFIFVYGAMLMRGVIEEKTSRVVEVIVSSVKPFQLMMGKVLGIALVGLTQFLLWVGLTALLLTIAKASFLPDDFINSTPSAQAITQLQQQAPSDMGTKIFSAFQAINMIEILGWFLFYFIGGYLLYGALFAMIGAAVDNETDTQQFMMPVTLPMIFAIYVAISAVENPNGPVAQFCSIFPLTSPVVMMVRIPFDVPIWEKILSAVLLVTTFVGTIWVAAKIYRIGILMYGKKVTYKELWKWLWYKG